MFVWLPIPGILDRPERQRGLERSLAGLVPRPLVRRSVRQRQCHGRRSNESRGQRVIGQLLMVETKQMKNGCMKNAQADLILDGKITQFLGSNAGRTTLDSTSRHPECEAVGIVVKTVALCNRSTLKFRSQKDE